MIDAVPRCREAAAAIQEYLQTQPPKNITRPDPSHRCLSGVCSYYTTRRFSTPQRPMVVAVCKASQHTHVCIPGKCGLGVRMEDSTYACEITSASISGPQEVQYATLGRPTVGRKSCSGVHWARRRKHVKSNKPASRKKGVRTLLALLFSSPQRKKITDAATAHLRKSASKIAKRYDFRSFYAFRAVNNHIRENIAMIRPPAETIPEEVVDRVSETIAYVRDVGKRRFQETKKNDTCLTLGLVQLFSTGFSPLGSEILPVDPWVAKHTLSPVQVGKLPNLRCRQQTIAVRQIQRLLVTDDGEALLRPPHF